MTISILYYVQTRLWFWLTIDHIMYVYWCIFLVLVKNNLTINKIHFVIERSHYHVYIRHSKMIDWMDVYNDNNTHVAFAAAVCYLGAYTSTYLSTSLITLFYFGQDWLSYHAMLYYSRMLFRTWNKVLRSFLCYS